MCDCLVILIVVWVHDWYLHMCVCVCVFLLAEVISLSAYPRIIFCKIHKIRIIDESRICVKFCYCCHSTVQFFFKQIVSYFSQ